VEDLNYDNVAEVVLENSEEVEDSVLFLAFKSADFFFNFATSWMLWTRLNRVDENAG
jgi:hypothetical protein